MTQTSPQPRTATPPAPTIASAAATFPVSLAGSQPIPPAETRGISLWSRLSRGWDNFNFRTKLALLLITGTALPLFAATQGAIVVAQQRSLRDLEAILSRDLLLLEETISRQEQAIASEAKLLASLVAAVGIDTSSEAAIAANRSRLSSLVNQAKANNPGRSFYLITDGRGRTITQEIQIIAGDLSSAPPCQGKPRPSHPCAQSAGPQEFP
ncbi:MAG: hypothetical protein HC890_16690 [Chloroflexaceae bacterium]|nr:hypothetical protein [Chloroflexaceae bacterium]